MLRILLINDTPKKVGRLKSALVEAGFEVIDESGLTIDLPELTGDAVRDEALASSGQRAATSAALCIPGVRGHRRDA